MSITIRSAQTIQSSLKLQGGVPGYTHNYRYWKFLVTRIANPAYENNLLWQIGELVLKHNGNRIDYSTAVAYSTAGAFYSSNESPARAIDNDPTTKLCMQGSTGSDSGSSGLGWPLIIDFGKTVKANSMTYFTANDDSLIRDPVDWILWASNDGTTWNPIQWTQGYSPPADRETETTEFYFNPPFDNHITVPTATGGTNGNDTYTAWTAPNDNNDAWIPVGATAFGTNFNNHIGGIYTVTANIIDGGYQKITVQDGTLSTVFNVNNVGSNEPFEVYWNGPKLIGLYNMFNGGQFGCAVFDLTVYPQAASIPYGATITSNTIPGFGTRIVTNTLSQTGGQWDIYYDSTGLSGGTSTGDEFNFNW